MHRNLITAVVTCLLITATPARAEDDNGLSGHWVGAADLWGRPLLVELAFEGEAGTLDAFGEAPLSFDARILSGAPISVLSHAAIDIRFELALGRATYTFEGRQVGDLLAGELKGEGPATRLDCLRLPKVDEVNLARLVGLYQGDGRRLVVTWREYGGLRAIDLDSGEGHSLFAVDKRMFLSHRQILNQNTAQPKYRFPRDENGGIVALVRGSWNDPATLHRREAFNQDRVRFQSGDTELAGTLLLPPGKRPMPAVVLVHGSGPIYRTALLQRAVLFVENGVAAFIYDKRGTGASEGERRGDEFGILIEDVRAAVGAVRRHPAIDPRRVGLQGDSQAGYLIPLTKSAPS